MEKTPFAITLNVGSSLLNKTGSWRTERPVYLDRIPPCNKTCPAGENIQQWLYHAEEGRYEDAWREIMVNNPFPAVMGRVCYHTCESACNRGQLDESVGINAVERFLGDQAIRENWQIEPGAESGKKVLVIGAGPAGLSCAYHLRRLGHQVDLLEASPKAGGMMRYGIPKYRLPREKLNAEVQRIADMGVNFYFDSRVEDVERLMQDGNFDAAFVALGAQSARRFEIPVEGDLPVLDAVEVLRKVEEEEPTGLRGQVLVVGGGNTAIDVGRSAVRLGARQATVLVVEERASMPAHPAEISEALEEGVEIVNLRRVVKVEGNRVTVEVMVPGDGAWPAATGQFETLEADVIVQAIGQDVDPTAVVNAAGVAFIDGAVQVDSGMATGADRIYAGGDMVPAIRNVTSAIGQGKKAAYNIDAALRGATYVAPEKHEVADYDKLNTWYYTDAPRTIRPMLDIVRRQSGFAEVVGDLDEENAAYEARRCMSCGNCFECDNCYGVCPDNAVKKLGPGNRFEFKYDYCKGCGLCANECPCGAIKMESEAI